MSIERLTGSASANDVLNGSNLKDLVQGLAGDDTLHGNAGDDQLFGDYANAEDLNALFDGQAGTTMEAYGATDGWDFSKTEDGHAQMSQVLVTAENTDYTLSLDLATNLPNGVTASAVEIIWNGEVVETVDLSSGAFNTFEFTIAGTGAATALTVQTVEPVAPTGPVINTDGPIFSYDHKVEVQGEAVVVQAFAEGQNNVYQVLNGTLHLYDAENGSYVKAGANATVNVNAIGFNAEDGLIYGVASGSGVDSLGNSVRPADLIMLDADGNSYNMGSTPYRSWTGDFDSNGNLYVFESDMDRVTVIDVDQQDANGNPVSTTFKFPAGMITDKIYDVAFDAATQSFYGVTRAKGEGQDTVLYRIDVSQVADGGEPTFSTTAITQTVINGEVVDGAPAITFGATVLDADGNLYVGGNSGDHDMNDATGNRGGIYQVVFDADTGTASLVLLADAPGVGSNDGAADPTATGLINSEASDESILIRDIALTPNSVEGFDDTIYGGGGHDTIDGSIGKDVLVGDSQGDKLMGGDDADEIYGGAGPNWTDNGLVSVYDDAGNRYDQFGNLLPEDDDVLFGGAGDDMLSGSAGHDTLDGGLGQDILKGGTGFDILFGAQGNDELFGGKNEDVLNGGDGDDLLNGGSGDDELNGGMGIDTLKGGSGNDTLNGETGDDILDGSSGDDTLSGGFGEDSLKGGSGDDILKGDQDDDFLDGGSGNDALYGGEGRDKMKGNSGDDIMFGGDDRDNMNGGSGDDVMHGDGGKDYLNGHTGNDELYGGAGNDRIVMGEGSDIASGGAGADTFIFKSADTKGGNDQILDFNADEDMLNLVALNIADEDTWFSENVSLSDSQATIQMGETTLDVTFYGTTTEADLFEAMLF